MRFLTTETRRGLEEIIDRIRTGEEVTLNERIKLNKYAAYIPFMALKLKQATQKPNESVNGKFL